MRLLILFMLIAGVAWGDEYATTQSPEGEQFFSADYLTLTVLPATSFVIYHEGKEAVIDFGGDKVTYSGDMPIDKSAQMFFDYVFNKYKENYTCPKCGARLIK